LSLVTIFTKWEYDQFPTDRYFPRSCGSFK